MYEMKEPRSFAQNAAPQSERIRSTVLACTEKYRPGRCSMQAGESMKRYARNVFYGNLGRLQEHPEARSYGLRIGTAFITDRRNILRPYKDRYEILTRMGLDGQIQKLAICGVFCGSGDSL